MASLEDGIVALDGKIVNIGIVTTPQLHYVTRCLNTLDKEDAYGVPTEEGYYEKLSKGFKEIVVW